MSSSSQLPLLSLIGLIYTISFAFNVFKVKAVEVDLFKLLQLKP